MGTIGQTAAAIRSAREAFWPTAAAIAKEDEGLLLELQKDQLYAGQTPTGGYLSPTYSQDPYFKRPGAGERYAKWKATLSPRRPASHLAERPEDVPNLIVNGNLFYNCLSCTVKAREIKFNNAGLDMRPKYGDILGLNETSVRYYRDHHFAGRFNERLRACLAR